MRFRYSLGKALGVTNQVTDPSFATGCGAGNWNCDASWGIAAGTATWQLGVDDFMYQTGVFEAGEEYKIIVDNECSSLNVRGMLYIGDYSIDEFALSSTVLGGAEYTFDNVKCLSTNTRLTFRGCSNAAAIGADFVKIYSVNIYKYSWNTPIEIEPGQWENSNLELEEDENINSLIVKFTGGLDFTNESYDYLVAQPLGSRVPILIEYYDITTRTWLEFVEGTINTSELRRNPREKIINADVEESGIVSYVKTNIMSDVKFHFPKIASVSGTNCFNYTRRLDNGAPVVDVLPTDSVNFHRTTSGAYDLSNMPVRVKHQLREVIEILIQSSKMTIVADSTSLASAIFDDGSGNDVWLGNVLGHDLRNGDGCATWDVHSLREWLDSYGTIFKLATVFGKDGNNIPTLTIETYESILDTIPTITFTDVDIIDIVNAYKTEPRMVNIGYPNTKPGHEQEDKRQYTSTGLGLVETLTLNPAWMRISDAIWFLNPNNDDSFDQQTLFVEYYDDTGTWRSVNYGAGEVPNSYNKNILSSEFIDRYTTYLATEYRSNWTSDELADGPSVNPLVQEVTMKVPINITQLQDIRQNPFKYVGFTGYGLDTKGLVKRIKYPLKNAADGEAEAEIIILAES